MNDCLHLRHSVTYTEWQEWVDIHRLAGITGTYRRNFRNGSVTCRSLNRQGQALALLRTESSGQLQPYRYDQRRATMPQVPDIHKFSYYFASFNLSPGAVHPKGRTSKFALAAAINAATVSLVKYFIFMLRPSLFNFLYLVHWPGLVKIGLYWSVQSQVKEKKFTWIGLHRVCAFEALTSIIKPTSGAIFTADHREADKCGTPDFAQSSWRLLLHFYCQIWLRSRRHET